MASIGHVYLIFRWHTALCNTPTLNRFTLIELIVYVALTATILTTIVTFALNIVLTDAKAKTAQEVYAMLGFRFSILRKNSKRR